MIRSVMIAFVCGIMCISAVKWETNKAIASSQQDTQKAIFQAYKELGDIVYAIQQRPNIVECRLTIDPLLDTVLED